MVRIASRTDVADRRAIFQNRLVMDDVNPVSVDDHRQQFLRNALIARRQRGFLSDEILLPVDEDIHPRFDRVEIRAVFHRPYTPTLFKPHRQQRTRAIPAKAQIRTGLFDSVSKAHQVLRFAVDLITQLGYEIYCKPQYLMRLADAIEEAGADLGFRWYGARALLSMRLEKGWGVWTMEYRPDFNAVESGMDVFINWKKDFIGKEATLTARNEGVSQKLLTMVIDTDGIDVVHDEAILKDGTPVGYVSSGGYAHHVGQSMAMGYVATEFAAPGTTLQVEILGRLYDAEVLSGPIYDANGVYMRS